MLTAFQTWLGLGSVQCWFDLLLIGSWRSGRLLSYLFQSYQWVEIFSICWCYCGVVARNSLVLKVFFEIGSLGYSFWHCCHLGFFWSPGNQLLGLPMWNWWLGLSWLLCNRVPGAVKEDDSHCCKLAGHYAFVTLVNCLCCHHQITHGSILLALDNTGAPKRSAVDLLPKCSQQNLTMLQAIWKTFQASPIESTQHVHSHQDCKTKDSHCGMLTNASAMINWSSLCLSKLPFYNDGHWHSSLSPIPSCCCHKTSKLPEEGWGPLTLALLPLDLVLPKESPGSRLHLYSFGAVVLFEEDQQSSMHFCCLPYWQEAWHLSPDIVEVAVCPCDLPLPISSCITWRPLGWGNCSTLHWQGVHDWDGSHTQCCKSTSRSKRH